MGEYRLRRVEGGNETDVLRPEALKLGVWKEKGIVVKNMVDVGVESPIEGTETWVADKNGFDDNWRQALEAHYRRMKSIYRDAIPQARFIKNPDHANRNLIVQEYIPLADPTDVGDYYPVDIEDTDVKHQIRHFVDSVKDQMRRQKRGEPSLTPDLLSCNFVLSANEKRVAYIDSGAHQTRDPLSCDMLYLARLAMLAGATPDDVRRDPFFESTIALFPAMEHIQDAHDFYSALLDQEEKEKEHELFAEFN